MPERVLAIDDSATILKVVQLVLSKAGYAVHVATDGEEGLRIAEELRPDLILLDFVMPRLNGYQVCRALAASESLREVPVVLMSAKGEEVGERFVKVTGIVDYISKPFSPHALVAVVENTVARHRARGGGSRDRETTPIGTGMPSYDSGPSDASPSLSARETPPEMNSEAPETIGEREEITDATRLPAQDAAGSVEENGVALPREAELDTARTDALAALRQAIMEVAARDDLLGDEVAERLARGLPDALLEQLVAPLVRRPADPDEALAGDLARVPLTEVLSLLELQRHTGILTVRGASAMVEVCFRSGKVEYAGAEGLGEEFLLGKFLLEREAMSRQDLDLFFRSRGTSSKLSGAQLVKLNYITRDDLRAALARQACERVYEVLRWREGRFSLRATADLGPRAVDAALGLSVETILMEGIRRMNEWHVIEREIDDVELTFVKNDEAVGRLAPSALSREERTVVDLVNGKNSVRDIVRQSRMGTFEVSQMLFRLASIRLIRRRVQPAAV